MAKVAPAPDTIVVKPKDGNLDSEEPHKSPIDPDELLDEPAEEKKPEEDKKAEAAKKPVSVAKMFSLCGTVDYLLMFFGAIGALVNASSQPVSMIIFGDMVDVSGMTDSIMDKMADVVVKMCVIAGAGWVGASFQSGCYRLLALRLSKKMTIMYFDAVLHQDISWFDMQETAALPTSMADDMAKMIEAYGDKLAGAIMAVGCFIASFVVAFILGWQLALVTCAGIPFIVIASALMATAIQEFTMETQGWYAKAGAAVEECLFAMRTVVSFGGEKRELARYSEAVENARKGGVKNALKTGIGLGFMDAIQCWIYALALWFGSYCIYNDIKNPQTGEAWQGGEILTVFFCVFIGGFMLSQVEPGQKAMNAGRISGARFFGALDSIPVIQRRGHDERQNLTEIKSLALQDVHFSYPARPHIQILKGTSLTIKQGQKVAVVGESGSGKSTVMALLERFYDPIKGMVLVNDADIRQFSVTSLRRHIGYVGQEPVLFAASIKVNIMQGWSEAKDEDLDRVVKAANLNFVDALPDKLNTFVGSGGSQFSGGQKQRIAIARALLKKPSILFLDEATSALDNASEKMIQATTDKIASDFGGKLTIVSIAHRLSTIMGSDQIYVLKDGLVQECGNHAQLMEMKGEYFGLAASQQMAEEGEAEDGTDSKEGKEVLSKSGSKTPKDLKDSKSAQTFITLNADDEEEKRKKEIEKTYKVPMGRLLGYNKPEWGWFVPGIFGALMHGACYPLMSYLLVHTLESFYAPREQMKEDVTMLVIYFVILGVGVLLGTIVQIYSFGKLGEAMTMRLRVAILKHVFRQEIGFHDDPAHTPTLISNALQLWAYRVANLIYTTSTNSAVFASIVVGMVVAFTACWQMALVMLASIPILVITTIIQIVVMMGATKAGGASLEAQQTLSDAVQNAKTVHATGIEQMLVQHYAQLVEKQSTGIVWRSAVAGFAFGFSGAVPLIIMGGGFYFGAWLVENGDADFLGLMGALMGILFAGMGAGQAAVGVGDAAKAKLACHDMFKLLDRETLIDGLDPVGETPTWVKAETGNIMFQGVQFAYPFRDIVQVLKGVEFEVKAGMSVGLVGPSGGGKSTVMSLIQRFYDPVAGTVLVGSSRTPLNKVNIRWWRGQIGFVGQEPILFDTTVRNNVLYGFDESDQPPSQEWMEKCKQMSNLGFIDTGKGQGWDTQVGPRGSRLSGGQKQRVAICRALVRDPPVLLLDEATSALDTASEKVVQQALEAARQGRTSFAIAHRLSTVQDCDVILVAAEGVILENGTHAELMDKKGVYYKLQMQGHGKTE